MKGMSKIKRGTSFKGVSSYVINRDDPEKEQGQIIGGNMTGTTPAELTEEFEIAHSLRPEIEKPVWHNSLRLPENEKVSDAKWKQIGDDYMEKMGFSEMHPRVYVKHNDSEGQHIHIVASRVAYDGEIYLGRNENLKSTKHIQSLERQHSLTQTKAPEYEHGKVIMPEVKELKKGEIEMAVRKGVKPPRMKLREYIDDALKEKCTAVEFCERLEVVGVKSCPNITKTGKLNGFSFECEGIAFKGSDLGNNYKMAKLQERGLEYEQVRDCKKLTERKEQFSRELEKDRGLDQGVASLARSYSTRSVTIDRDGNQNKKRAKQSNHQNQPSDSGDSEYTGSDKNLEFDSNKIKKSNTNDLGEVSSVDLSGSDRSELGRSWKDRFREVDTTISNSKRKQHIVGIKAKSIEERNRSPQRNIEKKIESRLQPRTMAKTLKSNRDIGDDFSPSM